MQIVSIDAKRFSKNTAQVFEVGSNCMVVNIPYSSILLLEKTNVCADVARSDFWKNHVFNTKVSKQTKHIA